MSSKITDAQKNNLFSGVNIKNQNFVKLVNGNITLVRIDKYQESGGAIVNKQGYVGILKVYTSKETNSPHYYIDNYTLSFANNMKYVDQTPLTNDQAKKIAKLAGFPLNKFKDLDDAPKSNPDTKMDIKVPLMSFKEFNK